MNWRDQRDQTLVNWSRDLNQFAEPLTGVAIERTIRLLDVLRKIDSPVFTMVPDKGGIVVEYKIKDMRCVFNVWEDGDLSARVFEGTKLISNTRDDYAKAGEPWNL